MKANHELKRKNDTEIFDPPNKIEEHMKKEQHFKCKECDDALEATEVRKNHMDEKHSSCKVWKDEFTWAEEGHYCHYRINDTITTQGPVTLGPHTDNMGEES